MPNRLFKHIIKTLRLTFLIYFLTLGLWASAQELGNTFIQNYLPRQYGAETQNWSIAQDDRGIMYFANNSGVLMYDGVSWDLIPVANLSTVRSVAIDPHGKVYVGAEKEIGYLKPNASGKLVYESFLNLLSPDDLNFGTVWSIIIKDDEVYFQTYYKIFRYKKGKIKVWNVKNSYHRMFLVGDRLFVRQDGIGLTSLVSEEWKVVPQGVFFKEKIISAFLPLDNNRVLVGTRKDGLFVYDLNKGEISRFNSEINDFLIANQLYHGIALPNGSFAFATILKGMVIIDKTGKILQFVDNQKGLLSEAIYFMYLDKEEGLWLGADIGLTRLEVNTAFSFWSGLQGLRGSVLDIIRFEGVLYVSTSFGVFYLENGYFKAIKSIEGQMWRFAVVKQNGKKRLWVGGKTLYEINNKKEKILFQLPNNKNAFFILPSKHDPTRVWIATDEGLDVCYIGKNEVVYEGTVAETGQSCRRIAEEENGDLWLGTSNEGVSRVRFFPKGSTKSPKITLFNDLKSGLPSLRNVNPFWINGNLVFGTEKGLHYFDKVKEKFTLLSILGSSEKEHNIYNLCEDDKHNLWITSINSAISPTGIAFFQKSNSYRWESTPFRRVPQSLESVVYPDSANIAWIGGSEGLFRYDMRVEREYMKDFYALIRKVSIGRDSTLFDGNFYEKVISNGDTLFKFVHQQPDNFKLKLAHTFNSLTFHYGATSFEDEKSNLYRYKLEGYDKEWSEWTSETKKEYTNLPAERFIFRLEALSIYKKESFEATYEFFINPPWYQTSWAYGFYVLVAGFLVWVAIKLNTSRLEREKENLEKLILARTAEVVQKNAELEQQKQEIQSAYKDIETISVIGQKITATLDFGQLVEKLYHHINSLITAPVFGVGTINTDLNRIEFRDFMDNGEKHPFVYESLEDSNKFSVWCIRNREAVVINDLETDFRKYLNVESYTVGEGYPQSLIYLPLLIENEAIGAITVQSFEKNAYEAFDLTILQTLASYVAIALENANSYELIKESNRQITDSIRYARTIQKAILPSSSQLKNAFGEFFVIFRPKDIVSGDFYWFSQPSPNKILISVIDCTGHGVPGAFMSVIGSDILTELVNVEKIYSPNLILEALNQKVREVLRQAERSNDDGMDASMCLVEDMNREIKVSFSGAKRPLYYYSRYDRKLQEIKGNNKSIGGNQRKERSFTLKTVYLKEDDRLYLFSDGLVDQAGRDKITFGSTQLKRILENTADLSMESQKETIKQALSHYLENAIQRDDITILGVKL